MFLNRALQGPATTRRFFSTAMRQSGRRPFPVALANSASRRAIMGVIGQQHPRFLSTAAAPLVNSNPDMFCRQCEQTQDHFACTTVGVCGKTSETSALQDTLMHVVKAVSLHCVAARESGAATDSALMHDANKWTLQATFSTLTNVNFSDESIGEFISQGLALQKKFQELGLQVAEPDIANVNLSSNLVELEAFGHSISIPKRQAIMGNEDCFSLNEIGTYGMKGACAYASHAYQLLGTFDEDIMKDLHQVFAKLASNEADMQGLLANALRVGEINSRVLAMLDSAHAEKLGAPEPTQCRMTAVKGKAILVSGHDMVDLEELLKQTEGKNVNVYVHGEMVPALSYPALKKYDHLVGAYGTAWQNQKLEFAGFPGPVIVTTNCIQEPRRAYKKRLYTMNEVAVSGVQHIGSDRDYSPVIEQALSMEGFPKTVEPAKYHTVGFNHRVVLPLAGQVIEAVQAGALSRIVLIGGCDGSQWDRNYFTDLAENLPEDTLILTLGCAKNRVIHSEKLLGATLANGMPRVMDMGQCNDSYSAVVVATELAKALNCGVNDLPLSLALSHLEQKAAAVLLTLLSMGVKNIRLGPSLPAYVTPNVLSVLSENYNLMPTGNYKEDVAAIMEGK